MKFLLVGNFSGKGRSPDGQLIKTQQIYEAMKVYGLASIDALDTSTRRFLFFFRLWKSLRDSDHMFLLPGKRLLLTSGLFLKVHKVLARSSRVAIHLLVVGGWLPAVCRNPFYKWSLATFDSISPEAFEIAQNLGISSRPVYLLPNFRLYPDVEEELPQSKSNRLDLLFVSRLTRSKGLFDAIQLAQTLYEKGLPVNLQIFGPLNFNNHTDQALFSRELLDKEQYVQYLGVLEPELVLSTLRRNDCLLFPSIYPGEGFPGIIVESLLAGIPVITRNHLYLSSLNEQFNFGFVTEGDYVDEAASVLEQGHHLLWKKDWKDQKRLSDLRKSFGYSAFEDWIEEILFSKRD